MKVIAETARQLLSAGSPFVLATIFSRHGSAPRTAGTRMIVAADGRATGTIGGGLFEARVAERASEVLASKASAVIAFDMSHDDVAGMDMICGGRVEVLLEHIKPGTAAAAVYAAWRDPEHAPEPCLLVTVVRFAAGKMDCITHGFLRNGQAICGDLQIDEDVRQAINQDRDRTPTLQTVTLRDALILIQPVGPSETVFIFGAGHVAKPTAGLAKLVGFRVWVVDDRPEFANADRFPEADDLRVVRRFEAALGGLPIDSRAYLVIVTRGHLHDLTVLRQALRTSAGYIGMIGSRYKRKQVFDALSREGFSERDLNRVHSPIGIDIGAESCEEIAVSIVAELVQARARNRGR